MKIEVEISEIGYQNLKRIAEVYGKSPEELVRDRARLQWYETATDGDMEEAIRIAKQKVIEEQRKKLFKRYRLHWYRLKKNKDGTCVDIKWRACPIPPGNIERELEENVGKYYYEVQKVRPNNVGGFEMNVVLEAKRKFFRTLKALKKEVNREFEKYGYRPYYKVGR